MTACSSCDKPLTLFIQNDEEDDAMQGSSSAPQGETVPDDVELSCGCHFHWQCLLDAYEVTSCPGCRKDISSASASGETQLLCNLRNEGGLHEGLDILPVLSEELYLKAYPEDRKPRAFLEFCREGDIEAVVDLLKASEEDDSDDEDEMEEFEQVDNASILRYQDPVGNMQSALHIAVLNGRIEVIWLLLLLSSNLGAEHFPDEVQQAAEQLQVSREDQAGKPDIRSLKDSDGNIAAHYVDVELSNKFNTSLLVSP